MSMSVVARGRVVSVSCEISPARGPIVSFTLGDAQFGIVREVEYRMEDLPVLEVNCRGDAFGQRVLDQFADDDFVIVVGAVHVSQPIERSGTDDLVLISTEADNVGADLARGCPGAATGNQVPTQRTRGEPLGALGVSARPCPRFVLPSKDG